MKQTALVLFWTLNVCYVISEHSEVFREKRWFGYRYTSTVIKPSYVTALIPSSCVQVEPSLPPCRNVRALNQFPKIVSGRLLSENEDNENLDEFSQELKNVDPEESSIRTTPLGWGEYLGLVAPTVTTTAIYKETTTIMDPRTVVTFSVRGCRPSRLPLDLATCPPSSVPILPSRTSKEVMTTTVFRAEITPPPGLIQTSEDSLHTSITPVEATEELKITSK